MVIPAVALMLGLGIWQLQRLQWKNALIADVEGRTHAAPIPLEQALKLPPAEAEWRQVRARGHFLHDRELYLYALRMGAPGVHVITPLEVAAGRAVLVDRGYVPDS